MTSAESLTLEHLVDRVQLSEVISELSAICDGKAQHIRDNWQDIATASNWTHHARMLEALARKITV